MGGGGPKPLPRGGIAIDSAGSLLLLDEWDMTVMKWQPLGVSGTPVGDVPGSVHDVVVLSNGTFFVTMSDKVVQFNPGSRLGTAIWQDTSSSTPTGLAADSLGNIYVALGDSVVRLTAGSWAQVVVAGGNGLGSGLHQLSHSGWVAVDSDFNVYVTDAGNHRVMVWAPGASSGTIVAGMGGTGASLDQLDRPAGIALDSAGALLVVDSGNHRVLRFVLTTTSTASTASADATVTATASTMTATTATSTTATSTTAAAVSSAPGASLSTSTAAAPAVPATAQTVRESVMAVLPTPLPCGETPSATCALDSRELCIRGETRSLTPPRRGGPGCNAGGAGQSCRLCGLDHLLPCDADFAAGCGAAPAAVCAGPREPCYLDSQCIELPPAIVGLGCNAGGLPNCRFCGFGEYPHAPGRARSRSERGLGAQRRGSGRTHASAALPCLASPCNPSRTPVVLGHVTGCALAVWKNLAAKVMCVSVSQLGVAP
mmetsp:Transcript_22089/g.69222  ORF Transcript_22089/g.69222 Transcript_22089/m.69222 type:complete len:485 (+) Transcript_22089:342-1796(+)